MSSARPVSVVLYVHNGEPHLRLALDSIMRQTHRDFELCVVDDGSTDATAALLEDWARSDARIRVEHQEALGSDGLHHTFNNALAMTRHELIAVANADDIWMPHKLERQVAAFDTDPHLDVCTHDGTFIDDRGRVLHGGFRGNPSPYPAPPPRPFQFVAGNPIPNPTTMFRRSILRRIGLQELGQQHDHQFWFKATVAGCRFVGLPDRLIRYRIHSGSESTSAHKKPVIARTHRESVAMMVDRYEIEALVPELFQCPGDAESRAWAYSMLACRAWERHNFTVAAQLWMEALGLSTDPAIAAGLGLVAVRRGDALAGHRLLRMAADGGSTFARALAERPDLAATARPSPWHGRPPAIAGLVAAGEAGELHQPPLSPTLTPDVVLCCEPCPSVDEVVAAIRAVFDHRGRTDLTLALIVSGAQAIETVVDAYDRLEAGDPDLARRVTTDVIDVPEASVDSVLDAHLMEGVEVRRLVESTEPQEELVRPEPELAVPAR